MSPTPPPPAPPPAEYRIDELARLAGATVRNVRAYQDHGLLPPPRRQGRVGLYDDGHLTRLRLIGRLLARGYTLANIAELVAGWEQGRDLGDVLGFGVARSEAEAGDQRLAEAARRRLVEAGVPVPEVRALGTLLAEAVDRIAARYVELVARYALPEPVDAGGEQDRRRGADVVRRLRPLAGQLVDAELAVAIERRTAEALRGRPHPPGPPAAPPAG